MEIYILRVCALFSGGRRSVTSPAIICSLTLCLSGMPRPYRCDTPPRGSTAALSLLVGHSSLSGLGAEVFHCGDIRSIDSFPQAAFPDHGFVGRRKATPCTVLSYFIKIPSKALCQYQVHVRRQGKRFPPHAARSGSAPHHGLSWSCPHAYDGSEPCLSLYAPPLVPFGFCSSY